MLELDVIPTNVRSLWHRLGFSLLIDVTVKPSHIKVKQTTISFDPRGAESEVGLDGL